MSDIFDERDDLKNIKALVQKIREEYDLVLGGKGQYVTSFRTSPMTDPLRGVLASKWPGNEAQAQFIRDIISLMKNSNLKLEDVK